MVPYLAKAGSFLLNKLQKLCYLLETTQQTVSNTVSN